MSLENVTEMLMNLWEFILKCTS